MKKYLLLLAAATFMFAACNPNNPDDPEEPDEPDQPEVTVSIKIDGEFEDWAAIDQSKVASAKNNPDSPWDAVKQMRVYANAEFVFYYFEFDNSQVKELLESATGTYINSSGEESANSINMRINLNTDGEFTSGYENYHLQCYDFIIEGTLAKDGKWDTFADATLHQRINKKWVTQMKGGQGLTMGAGNGNKFEIMLSRELFNNAAAGSADPKPMGDIFQTGLRFYGAEWSELSNMPNAAISDDNPNGWGNMLEIATDK